MIPSGISKGPWFQPSADFAAAASSAPSAAPWLAAVPAFFGAEKPMMVRQAMITGLRDFCAQLSAEAISSWSWPLIRRVAQP